ncbi:MAG: lysine--tRNA ligase [Thermoanaerobaculia bacterium]|nr:lysine--tRNA ligase [Thermoanaerobaculia bacterium]
MSELEQQIENRRRKRAALVEAGIDPYPHRFEFDLEPADVKRRWREAGEAELVEEEIELAVPGRVRAVRSHGKTTFLDLTDGTDTLQVMVRQKDLDGRSATVMEHLDLGDYLGVRGLLMRTRTGELTLRAGEIVLLVKALRPWPEKWHGLTERELRYRQRYVDLAVNEESRKTFEIRSRLVAELRRYLVERDFLEVETPMLQPIAGGAAARPFVTHHNALDMELYLRIAPELYLKRLLVGGLHRVFEINRNFRNEGISVQHNPEFTMLEFYWAYVDYRHLMDVTEEMLETVVERVLDRVEVEWKGERLSFARPFARYSMRQALVELGDCDVQAVDTVEGLEEIFRQRSIEPPEEIGRQGADGSERRYGYLLAELFEQLVESRLIAPTLIYEYPAAVSPLSKQSPEDPRFVERFELYAGGMELVNAFSELNDPDTQAERFRSQLEARAEGDEEAHRFDEDYIRAMEYGMPPAGGFGLGIDRLTMLLTGATSIRDVILFPQLRPDA